MDFYSVITQNGGKALQRGIACREFTTKDGTKFIRQLADRKGNVNIDIYDNIKQQAVYSFRKNMRPDRKSFSAKSYNSNTQQGIIQSVLKTGKPKEIMQTLFKTQKGTDRIFPKYAGDFISTGNKTVKGKVIYYPSGNASIHAKEPGIRSLVETFNNLFGKTDVKVFDGNVLI